MISDISVHTQAVAHMGQGSPVVYPVVYIE